MGSWPPSSSGSLWHSLKWTCPVVRMDHTGNSTKVLCFPLTVRHGKWGLPVNSPPAYVMLVTGCLPLLYWFWSHLWVITESWPAQPPPPSTPQHSLSGISLGDNTLFLWGLSNLLWTCPVRVVLFSNSSFLLKMAGKGKRPNTLLMCFFLRNSLSKLIEKK